MVIVHKNLQEICLCVNYFKLNSITLKDAFPLPQIDQALQAVNSINWFSPFDLVHGYLQLAMDEDDMKKTDLELGLQAPMSLHACILVCQTQALAFVISQNNI